MTEDSRRSRSRSRDKEENNEESKDAGSIYVTNLSVKVS